MNTLPPNLERVVGSFIPWARRDDFIRAFPSQEHVVVRYIALNHHDVPDNALQKHVVLPEGLQEVGVGAFSGCSSLTTVTVSYTHLTLPTIWQV